MDRYNLCLGVRGPAPRYRVACESCSASNPSIYLSIYLALACAAWAASPPETRAVARRKSASTLVRGRVRVRVRVRVR
eukprot:scaffold109844_cov60-Phaeocystis_antarctica.AAC.1